MTLTVGIIFPRFLLDNLLNMYEKLTLNIMYNACKKKKKSLSIIVNIHSLNNDEHDYRLYVCE